MLIQLLFIQILTFIGLLVVLRFLFSRHLNSALNRLNTLQEENLAKEAQLNEELKRAQEEKEAIVARAREQANSIIEEAKKEALRLRAKLEEESRQQVDRIIAQAQKEIEQMKEKQRDQIEQQSLELALRLIEKTFTADNKESIQRQFIDEVIEEIARIPQDKFLVSVDTLRVVSSFPLEESQRQSLRQTLEQKIGQSVKLEEQIDKDLVCGLRIEMPGLLIDGTLRNRLIRAISEIKS